MNYGEITPTMLVVFAIFGIVAAFIFAMLYYFARARMRALFVRDLLQLVTQMTRKGEIVSIAGGNDSELTSILFHSHSLTFPNDSDGADEEPRPMRVIDGKSTTLLRHPFWGNCRVTAFQFSISGDGHTDSDTRIHHGIVYTIVGEVSRGRNGPYSENRAVRGIINKQLLVEFDHDALLEEIFRTGKERHALYQASQEVGCI